jgi:DNA primase
MINKWISGFPEAERHKIVKAAKITLRKPEGKVALDYLVDKRKFTYEVMDRFDVGYCPVDVNHEVRGRIITPIYSTYGDLVAISTRHLDKNHHQRFLHESFDKGSYLYGLDKAKEAIQRSNKVIIVEGECDVLCMHTYGFNMTVGLCGSALTLFQISLLSKYCENFYLLLDGDDAGRDSIKRAMKDYDKYNLEAYGVNFIPVHLPDGSDPDEFIISRGKRNMVDKLRSAKEECLL